MHHLLDSSVAANFIFRPIIRLREAAHFHLSSSCIVVRMINVGTCGERNSIIIGRPGKSISMKERGLGQITTRMWVVQCLTDWLPGTRMNFLWAVVLPVGRLKCKRNENRKNCHEYLISTAINLAKLFQLTLTGSLSTAEGVTTRLEETTWAAESSERPGLHQNRAISTAPCRCYYKFPLRAIMNSYFPITIISTGAREHQLPLFNVLAPIMVAYKSGWLQAATNTAGSVDPQRSTPHYSVIFNASSPLILLSPHNYYSDEVAGSKFHSKVQFTRCKSIFIP